MPDLATDTKALDLPATGDPSGDAILQLPGDPDYARLAAVLPQNNSWDFIGTTESNWKFLVSDKGRIFIETTVKEDSLYNYRKNIFTIFEPVNEQLPYAGIQGVQSLEDGFLPVSHTSFRLPDGIWTQSAFASTDANGKTEVLIRVRHSEPGHEIYYSVDEPEGTTPEELLALPPAVTTKLPDAKRFETRLAELKQYWYGIWGKAVQFSLPEKRVENAVKAGIIKSLLSQVNGAPRYGVTRYFCDSGRNAESFPPTTSTLVNCCLYYGLFDTARHFLGYHLDNFVSPQGRLQHRDNGAALAEHGMFLDCIARYIEFARDQDFLVRYKLMIRRIALYLIWTRHADDNGLIKGCAEDDTRQWPDNYWFSGNMWACRGLMKLGDVLKQLSDHPWKTFGEFLSSEAELFHGDIHKTIEASIIRDSAPPFLPPYPDMKEPFPSMTADIQYSKDEKGDLLFSAYTNYRFYPEMLSSAVLNIEQADILLNFRRQRGGEFCGLTRFKFLDDLEMLDDWPLYNQLYGLLNYGKIKEFQMAFYGHMAHHQARETFFAPEGTWFDKLDSIHCVPSQLTVPLALRWMLIFECPNLDVLHLFKGVPVHWLVPGKEISVENAPTKYGRISISLKIRDNTAIGISLKTSFERMPGKIILHVRNLNGYDAAIVGNCELNRDGDCIEIFPGQSKVYNIELKLKGAIK
jgi:hypothetical protein